MSLLLGSLREATGALHASERAYRVACDAAPLDLSFQPAVAKQLDRARAKVAAIGRWRRRLFEWQPREDSHLTAEEERRLRQFRSNILDNLDSGPTAPPLFLVPGIRSKKYFDPAEFAGVREVEAATDAMRAEFLNLVESSRINIAADASGSHDAESTSPAGGKWSMVPLIRNGIPVDEFASLCPVTMEVAKGLNQPKLGLISPSLYFSILEPGSRIPPHIGITSARAIAHFPIIVPDDCGFAVGGETRRWEVGKAMIFDDMTMHEAWNDSSAMRVVVIADVWRPELSASERREIEALMDCSEVARAG
ncbi:MAG: aspartyl/asparaginyl beta-hydroxylase domain-containing protein [Sphingomicrobium sp.]